MSRKGWTELFWPPLCPNKAGVAPLTLAQNDLALLWLCILARRFYFILFFLAVLLVIFGDHLLQVYLTVSMPRPGNGLS